MRLCDNCNQKITEHLITNSIMDFCSQNCMEQFYEDEGGAQTEEFNE